MIDSHHLTSRFHLRSEGNILALVTQEGKDCFLYRKMFRDDLFDEAKLAQSFSRHDFGRQFRERNADGLAHEWDGARGARVDFEHAVDQHGTGSAHILCAWLRILRSFLQCIGQNVRYCTRNARATQINCGSNVAPQIRLVINELHAAATEDERWSNENWIANAIGDRDRLFHADSGAVRGLAQTKFVEHNGEELAIFRHLDALRLGAENGNAGRFQSVGEIEGRLSAELHDYAFGFFLIVNIEHVLKRKRLKIKFVAGVVIGRNRFRIGIYHDGFETELAQSEGGVDAAIIKFDALADAVGTATENHDFAFAAFAALILASVGGII